MIKDLRANAGLCSAMERVTLVDEAKRITCDSFNVFIPSLMNGIKPGIEPINGTINKAKILNDDKSFISDKVNLSGCILAKSIHPYRFKHEGWIPEYKTATTTYKKTTHPTGTSDKIAGSSSDGVTDGAPMHPPHPITKAFKIFTANLKNFIFNNSTSEEMVHTNSTEVDYQELNRIYIKKGHPMYGAFVNGSDGEFVILAIDKVVPYYNETEDNGTNDAMPTTDPN